MNRYWPGNLKLNPSTFWLTVLPLAVLLLLCSNLPTAQAEMLQLSGKTMGTTYHISLDVSEPAVRESADETQLSRQIEDRLAEINSRMSTYDPQSELSRFNLHDGTDWFVVSGETALVVQRAIELHAASDGAFDVTVMPLVNLWGFGPQRTDSQHPPDEAEIRKAMENVGSQHLSVRMDPPALKKSKSGLQVDLSAIAKGYAVDAISRLLSEQDLRRHMVEIGGEVRVGMRKSDGSLWRIGIEAPQIGNRELSEIVELENIALASSGNYRNFIERDGKRFGHTINPRTGHPAEVDILAASILAEDCMTADAVATTCMVLGIERAKEFTKQQQCRALLFHEDDQHQLTQVSIEFPLAQTGGQAAPSKSSFWPLFVAALVVFLGVLVLMSLGVMISGRRIKGSCGAIASGHSDITSPCDLCSKPIKDCPEKAASEKAAP
jgi:thiamine biosynthesis lipoprotein